MLDEIKADEETAATISSKKRSDERTEEVYHDMFWSNILTKDLHEIVKKFDGIIQASLDSIVVSTLCALPPLCDGATVSQSKNAQGRPIILYWAYFARSGTGKSVGANVVRKYMLFWLDDYFVTEEKSIKEESHNLPDVFLDTASAEGFEHSIAAKSAPHFFLDEYGKFYRASKNDTVKASLLRMLMQIFDSGVLITRKLKDSKRSKHLMVQGMGLYAASTIGPSNLTPSDMRDMIADGMLNRFLVIFGDIKDIPLKQELSQEEADAIEKFARSFRTYAGGKNFYLSNDAFHVYRHFHHSINQRFRQKYINEDDTAGFEIRLLTIVQRIAMLLQISLNIEFKTPDTIEISPEAMDRAVRILDYLHERHFQKVLMYAHEKQKKSGLEVRIRNQLLKGKPCGLRDIVRNVSPATTAEVREILDELVEQKWAQREGSTTYTKVKTDTDKDI